MQAPTGVGKTLAFSIPVLSMLNTSKKILQALIVAPTQDLVVQIAGVMYGLSRTSPSRIFIETLPAVSLRQR